MRAAVVFITIIMLLSTVTAVSAHDYHHEQNNRDYYNWADRQYTDYQHWVRQQTRDNYQHDRHRYDHDDHKDRSRVIYREVYYNQPRVVHVYRHHRPVVVHDSYPYHYRGNYNQYW